MFTSGCRPWLKNVSCLMRPLRVNTADVYDHPKTIAMHRRGQGSNEVSRGLFLESPEKFRAYFG